MKKNAVQESKQKIADAFQSLLEEKDFSRITVSEVMRKCGMTRQMFYHYFQDIDDLVFWIYLKNNLAFSEEFFEEENFVKALGQTLETMASEKRFYKDIIKRHGPNSFAALFYDHVIENTHKYLGKKRINDDVEFCMMVYWKGTVYAIENWIMGGMKMPPYELAEKCYLCMPALLRKFYE